MSWVYKFTGYPDELAYTFQLSPLSAASPGSEGMSHSGSATLRGGGEAIAQWMKYDS